MAKTYYDGEEREIVKIGYWTHHPKVGAVWLVTYKRGESIGQIMVAAKDELDAMRKFPEALKQLSKNDKEF